MLVSAMTRTEPLMASMRASRNSGVIRSTMSVSATAAIMSPVWSLTHRYRPLRMPSQRSLSERSSPMAWHSRQHISPKVSPPKVLTNFTSCPSSRRLWAILRATPPHPRVTCPGTESAGTKGAVNAAEMSMLTPPITVTYSLMLSQSLDDVAKLHQLAFIAKKKTSFPRSANALSAVIS